MKRVYFQPIGEVNQRYEKCMNTPIDVKELEGLVDEKIYKELVTASKKHTINLWGVQEGKSEHGKSIWETMDINDWVIFTSQRKIWSAGKVLTRTISKKISKKFLNETGFDYIYFVTDRKNIDIPTETLSKELDLKTSKIDSTFVVRRFDGLGLSKNEKIFEQDDIDNEKLVKYLEDAESKAELSKEIPPAPVETKKETKVEIKKEVEVKTEKLKTVKKPKVTKEAKIKTSTKKAIERNSRNLTLINHSIIKKMARKNKPLKRNVKQIQAKNWYMNKLIYKA